jgi:hypothetical protein
LEPLDKKKSKSVIQNLHSTLKWYSYSIHTHDEPYDVWEYLKSIPKDQDVPQVPCATKPYSKLNCLWTKKWIGTKMPVVKDKTN